MKEITTHPRNEDIAEAVRDLIRGGSNATGTVTLTVSVATTTVANPLVRDTSVPILIPMTAAAAAEVGAGTLFISAVNRGNFVVGHANSATAGRTYRYALVGG
jgi:Ethanolamine utilization protein EutJ (predicted chaperonin)